MWFNAYFNTLITLIRVQDGYSERIVINNVSIVYYATSIKYIETVQIINTYLTIFKLQNVSFEALRPAVPWTPTPTVSSC